MGIKLSVSAKKIAAGLVFLGAVATAILAFWDVFERGTKVVQEDPFCKAEEARFLARVHDVNEYYQREFRKFPFPNGLPDFEPLESLVGQIDTCPEITKIYPVESANALLNLGVRWLVDNEIHPKNRLRQAIPLFERSYKISREEFIGNAIIDLKESLLPENKIEGALDAIPFMYYTIALTTGTPAPSLAEFRAAFKNDPSLVVPAIRASLGQSEESKAEYWLLQEATLSSIADALKHKEREYFVSTGDRRYFEKASQKEANALFRVKTSMGSCSYSWRVDLQTYRYQSLTDETAEFMRSEVSAMPSTFSKKFNEMGLNPPLRLDPEKFHSYTSSVVSWFFDEGGPQGIEGFLAALFATIKNGEVPSDDQIGDSVNIDLNAEWIDKYRLELRSTAVGDIGTGYKEHKYVWCIYHLEGRYDAVSADARMYELLCKLP